MAKNSREIIQENLHGTGRRPGLDFSGSRLNDFVGGGPGDPSGYTPKRYVEGDREYYDDYWGNLWCRMVDGCTGGEVCRPALTDWEQLRDYRMPEFDRQRVTEEYRAGFAREPDRWKVAWMPWIFASARYLRKLDNYLMDMVLCPEELHELHRRMGDVIEELILAAADAGADSIMFCEDMGTQTDLLFSPEMWEEYFGLLYRRLFALAHERGMAVFMHSCGQNRKILELLLQAGVNVFQFDQPAIYDWTFLRGLLEQYQAVLYSPVDIQKVLPTGDRALIESHVDRMVKEFGGRLIFKNYPDLHGIGVRTEWDDWAYSRILTHCRKC